MHATRSLSLLAGVSFIAACAAAPKPVMSDARYTELGGLFALSYKCGEHGLMSPETSSLGQRYIQGTAASYTFDPARMQQEVERYRTQVPSSSDCNRAAMGIADRKRQIDQNNVAVAADQKAWSDLNNNRPKQTYCNQVGTQTLCSTY